MKGNAIREINHRVFRRVVWVGKAALLCLGLLAMVALVVVMTVLTAVMLAATALPKTVAWHKRDPRVRRYSGYASEFSAPRKAVASPGQQGR